MSLSNAQIKFWGFEELTSKGQSEPANPVDFYELVIFLEKSVHESNRERSGSIFIVCTPAGTDASDFRTGWISLTRYHLVIERWDRDVIQGALQALCDSAPDSDWENVARSVLTIRVLGVRAIPSRANEINRWPQAPDRTVVRSTSTDLVYDRASGIPKLVDDGTIELCACRSWPWLEIDNGSGDTLYPM